MLRLKLSFCVYVALSRLSALITRLADAVDAWGASGCAVCPGCHRGVHRSNLFRDGTCTECAPDEPDEQTAPSGWSLGPDTNHDYW